MTPGQIVIPKSGRDKGLPMVIVGTEDEYAFIADGKMRRLDKPKKKKHKHLQITHTFVNLTPPCGRALQDADLRKALRAYSEGR